MYYVHNESPEYQIKTSFPRIDIEKCQFVNNVDNYYDTKDYYQIIHIITKIILFITTNYEIGFK